MPNTQDREIIGVPLQQLTDAVTAVNNFICCVRTPQMVEVAIPYHAHPFWISGEIFQFDTQLNQSILIRVPAGQSGVITGLAIGEHFPGMMAGTRITLLVNGEAVPAFPRVSGLVGLGTGQPLQTWIPLPEAAEVSVMLDCPWINDTFTDHLQFGVPWVLRGYYMDKEYFVTTQDNAAVPQALIPGAGEYPNVDYQVLEIPEWGTATSLEQTPQEQPPNIANYRIS